MRVVAGLVCLTIGVLSAAENRVVRPVNYARGVVLKGHVHPRALASADRGPVDGNMPIRHATLMLRPAADISSFLTDVQVPTSSNYRQWLTPDQFGERFGLSTDDLAKVTGWLESEGLKVERVARGRHWIQFSGTAAQAGRTFRTELRRYLVDGQIHFSPGTEPSVPEALESVIAGIRGLDDFRLEAQPKPLPQSTASNGTHTLSPGDFATIYNLKPLYAAGIDGTGQKIVVVGATDLLGIEDVRSFRQLFNLPASDPVQILVGDDPGFNSAYGEAMLDIQWSGAVAPGAQILYVYAINVLDAVQYAVDENIAPVLSMSFGGCEAFGWAPLRGLAQQANAQGVTFLASSGDQGGVECDRNSPSRQANKGLSVGGPASFPEVTAVGGTQFNEGSGRYWAAANDANGASALSYIPEVVWNESSPPGFWSSGGGASTLFAKPYWQIGPGVPNDKARDLPDISLAAAGGHDGILIGYLGGLATTGGTSASSPAFAGVIAMLNQYLLSKKAIPRAGLGNINPALYRLSQANPAGFHDIIEGDNIEICAQGSPGCVNGRIGHSAQVGYDLATGLGTIDTEKFVTGWTNGTPSVTSVKVEPGTVAVDDTVKLTATVSGTGAAFPSGRVTFLNRLEEAAIGSADLSLANGIASASISVPANLVLADSGIITAVYSGDAFFNASGDTTTVAFKRVATGSVVVPFVSPNPVYRSGPGANWPYFVSLTEKNGVTTTLTAFTVDGVAQSLASWSSTVIPARGSVGANLAGNLAAPRNRLFHFEGKDQDGTPWTTEMTVPFLDYNSQPLNVGFSVTSLPATVVANSENGAACQWSHEIVVQENGGFATQLTMFRLGTTDLSGSIQSLFGTTRLAPWGTLRADVCLGSNNAAGTRAITVAGAVEIGGTYTAGTNVNYAAPPIAPLPSFSVTPRAISIEVSGATESGNATIVLNFASGSPAWTVLTAGLPAWLKVSPASGTGNGELSIQADPRALSNGAYRAVISIVAEGALPQAINVPFTFIVGTASGSSVARISNAASAAAGFAPGTVVVLSGEGLAPSATASKSFPLPYEIAGVSATVNGVSAPIFSVAPDQVRIQVPYEIGLGAAIAAIDNNGVIAAIPLNVAVAAPGIYTSADGSLSTTATARAGQALTLYMTGEGDLNPSTVAGTASPTGTAVTRLAKPRLPVAVTVGGVAATVTFAGEPVNTAGVMQVNFTLPAAAALGAQNVVVTVGGIASPPAKLTVTN
jgi:uncharacterized protein (TIGR03437 family)